MDLKADEGYREEIWVCKIGGMVENPIRPGGDYPMRQAIEKAFFEITGVEAEFCFSGWGADLTDGEREIVERDRKKSKDL